MFRLSASDNLASAMGAQAPHVAKMEDSVFNAPLQEQSDSAYADNGLIGLTLNGRAPAAKDTRASTSTNRNILGYEEVDTVADVAAVHKKLLAEVSAVPGTENPFYVVDLGDVHRKYAKWVKLLPRVTPHYAVKCHNDPLILDALASLGIGFDCASEAEIRSVVARGVSPDKIVYANPCKPDNQVLASKDLGVALTVFDNANELEKIKRVYPETKLLLRIMGDDSFSICQFNSKFGASHTEYAPLLAKARELGLDVVGVSFHVGSGCTSAAPFGDAIGRAKRCFELAKTYGFEMTVLDLGGGFPGDKMAQVSFEAIAVNINEALDAHFPAGPATDNLRIIAEPGRYFVSSCSTLASRIIAKRVVPAADEKGKTALMYYQNEGVYAAFNCVLYDHQEVFAHPLKDPKDVTSEHNCQVWGPSCDSMDRVLKDYPLPDMEVGDWLYYENMGAYTFCARSTFNGYRYATPMYVYTHAKDVEVPALPHTYPIKATTAKVDLTTTAWMQDPVY